MNDISNKIKWAIEKADIPILLMVLYHFTGDKKWLNPPFKPVLDFSFFAHESGGLDSALQSQVRSAALDLLNKFFVSGKLPDLKISDETYLEMMSTCVGEDVPEEYLNMMLEEMQLKERYGSWKEKPDNNTLTTKNVIIIGAGVSGMLMGVKLREAGIPFVIIEKNNDIGGTWFEILTQASDATFPTIITLFHLREIINGQIIIRMEKISLNIYALLLQNMEYMKILSLIHA